MKRYVSVIGLDVVKLIKANTNYSLSADKLIFDLDMDSVKGYKSSKSEIVKMRKLLKEIVEMIRE